MCIAKPMFRTLPEQYARLALSLALLSDGNSIAGTVVDEIYLGDRTDWRVRVADETITVAENAASAQGRKARSPPGRCMCKPLSPCSRGMGPSPEQNVPYNRGVLQLSTSSFTRGPPIRCPRIQW